MCESSLTRGLERTRSVSTTVSATCPTVTAVATWEWTGVTVPETVGDATSTGVGVVSGEAASRDGATELTGGVGATELLHPAVKTT